MKEARPATDASVTMYTGDSRVASSAISVPEKWAQVTDSAAVLYTDSLSTNWLQVKPLSISYESRFCWVSRKLVKYSAAQSERGKSMLTNPRDQWLLPKYDAGLIKVLV